MYQGNKTNQNDFLEILKAVERSTMKRTHVADVCIVRDAPMNLEGNLRCTCQVISTGAIISAIPLDEDTMKIKMGDVVVVLYMDTDFRINFLKLNTGQAITYGLSDDANYHDQAFGIIIGILNIKET